MNDEKLNIKKLITYVIKNKKNGATEDFAFSLVMSVNTSELQFKKLKYSNTLIINSMKSTTHLKKKQQQKNRRNLVHKIKTPNIMCYKMYDIYVLCVNK